ncbi:Oleosin 5 [Nymphaea thermarum]|nr:Oleosin 5 [Nymphaea thermarum]
MADGRAQVYQTRGILRRNGEGQMKGSTVLYATTASLAIACPLVTMMCLSLFASFAVLLFASPLLLIFSPLIVPAAVLLGGAVTAFALATLMAIAGISAFSWIYRSLARKPSLQTSVRGMDGGPTMVTEAGFEAKGPDTILSADGQVQKKVQVGALS